MKNKHENLQRSACSVPSLGSQSNVFRDYLWSTKLRATQIDLVINIVLQSISFWVCPLSVIYSYRMDTHKAIGFLVL